MIPWVIVHTRSAGPMVFSMFFRVEPGPILWQGRTCNLTALGYDCITAAALTAYHASKYIYQHVLHKVPQRCQLHTATINTVVRSIQSSRATQNQSVLLFSRHPTGGITCTSIHTYLPGNFIGHSILPWNVRFSIVPLALPLVTFFLISTRIDFVHQPRPQAMRLALPLILCMYQAIGHNAHICDTPTYCVPGTT